MNDDIWLGEDVLPLTNAERETLQLALLAIAATCTTPTASANDTDLFRAMSASLLAENGMWRVMLSDRLASVPQRRGLIAAIVCTTNPLIPADIPWDGRITQRINGVLDILAVAFSAEDVSVLHGSAAEQLRRASQNDLSRRSVDLGKMLAGGIAGAHGQFWVAKHIERAGDYITDRTTAWDDTVERAAQLVVAHYAMTDTGDRGARDIVTAVARELDIASRLVASLKLDVSKLAPSVHDGRRERLNAQLKPQERRLRILRAAADAISPDGQETLDSIVLPDVTGLTLPDATSVLAAHGWPVEAFDSVAPGGRRRWMMTEGNWLVSRQTPSAGTQLHPGNEVSLACRRSDDLR